MKRIVKELLLDRAGVDAASGEMEAWLGTLGETVPGTLRVRLTMEELLLRISEHFGGNVRGTLILGRHFGVPCVRFRYQTASFDPTKARDSEMNEWTDRLLANMGLTPAWSYRLGRNELVQTIALPKRSSQLNLVIALGLAILLGFAGLLFPAGLREGISAFVLEPVSTVFTRLLYTFVGPLMFLSVIAGICGIGNTGEFGRIGKRMVTRFVVFSFLGSGAAVLTRPFFRLTGALSGSGESQLIGIRDLLLEILPSNPIRPFYDGNTLQIICLAVLIGIILLGMGERSARVRQLLADWNDIVMQAIRMVCRLLPLFVFSSFTLQIWSNGAAALTGFWKPIVICAALGLLILIFKLAVTCTRLKAKAPVLLKKIFPGMLLGFTTSSGAIAFGTCAEANETRLGIPEDFSRFGYSIASTLYASVLSTLFIFVAYYAAETCGVGVNVGWMLILWIVGTVMGFAAPPVSGGAITCVGMLIAQLGLPVEIMASATVLAFILDFIVTGFALGMRHLELALQADRLGILDLEMLRNDKN